MIRALAIALLLSFGSHAQAALVYDSFDTYATGAELNTLNGGTGSGGLAWNSAYAVTDATDSTKVTIAEQPLNYSSGSVVVNGGTKALLLSDDAVNDGLIRRGFTSQTGPVYFSFLYQANAGTDAGDFLQFNINDANDTDRDAAGSIGTRNATGNPFFARIRSMGTATANNGTDTTSGDFSTALQGQTYFLVGKLSIASGTTYNQVDLWVDPDGDIEAGQTIDATVTANTGASSMTALLVRTVGLELGDRYLLDEFRIGTSFEEVVPVPEPNTWVLACVGLGVIAIIRRRVSGYSLSER